MPTARTGSPPSLPSLGLPLWARQIGVLGLSVFGFFIFITVAPYLLGTGAYAYLRWQYADSLPPEPELGADGEPAPVDLNMDGETAVFNSCLASVAEPDSNTPHTAEIARTFNETLVLCLMNEPPQRLCKSGNRRRFVAELVGYLDRKQEIANDFKGSASTAIESGAGPSRDVVVKLRALAAEGYISRTDFSPWLANLGGGRPRYFGALEGVEVTKESCK